MMELMQQQKATHKHDNYLAEQWFMRQYLIPRWQEWGQQQRKEEEKRGEKYILTVTQREPDYPELI